MDIEVFDKIIDFILSYKEETLSEIVKKLRETGNNPENPLPVGERTQIVGIFLALQRGARITYLSDLRFFTANNILKVHGIGEVKLSYLKSLMSRCGIKFQEEKTVEARSNPRSAAIIIEQDDVLDKLQNYKILYFEMQRLMVDILRYTNSTNFADLFNRYRNDAVKFTELIVQMANDPSYKLLGQLLYKHPAESHETSEQKVIKFTQELLFPLITTIATRAGGAES